MTLHEFGELLRKKFPDDAGNAPSETLAIAFLKRHPQFNYLVNSASRQIHGLLQKPWYRTWEEQSKISGFIQQVSLNFEASLKGVDIPTLMTMKLNEQSLELKIREMKAELEHTKEAYKLKQIWGVQDASNKRNSLSARGSKTPTKEHDGLGEQDASSVARDEDGSSEASGVGRRRSSNSNR